MKRSSRAMGWCTKDGKLLYASRKVARQAAREHVSHKNEYQCSEIPGLWHIGEVPERVIRGEMTRNEYYGKDLGSIETA